MFWVAVVQYVSGKPVNEDSVHKMKDAIKEGTTRAFSSLKPVTKVPGAIFGPGQLHNIANIFESLNCHFVLVDVEPAVRMNGIEGLSFMRTVSSL